MDTQLLFRTNVWNLPHIRTQAAQQSREPIGYEQFVRKELKRIIEKLAIMIVCCPETCFSYHIWNSKWTFIEENYLPPLNSALQGNSKMRVCGGMIPIIELWWSIVEILLAWTDTKLPPIPLTIGWNTTNPLNISTALSSTRPPNLQIKFSKS